MHAYLLTEIKGIWLSPETSAQPIKGKKLSETHLLEDGFIRIEDGKITEIGPMAQLIEGKNDLINSQTTIVNCQNRFVLPSFVDAHTHLVFAAWRENEMEMRLKGKTYQEIAAAGGGILNSAARMATADEEALYQSAHERLQNLMRMGTGAIEIKSGYGLSLDAELKMLRVIRRLKESAPIPVKATFLGAHAIPKSYTNRQEYIDLVVKKMIPAVADQGLADYCDVFCDTGFFTQSETEEILEAGLKYGLKPKVHANELARSGGVQAAVKVGAVSADHLECMEKEELDLLQQSQVIPVLLPGTAFFLHIHPPDARRMIEHDLPVALSSDYNPGTCPSGNMELVVAMACHMLKMQPAEALHAATINSAWAMGLENFAGQLAVGRTANLLVTKPIPSISFIPYHFGETAIEKVMVNGNWI